MLIDKLVKFYRSRESVRVNKEAGIPPPWTTDPIFRNYRFCNMHREDDKVTKWIKANWRDPYDGHPNMVVAMVLARLFNQPETLNLIGFPETFSIVEYKRRVELAKQRIGRIFNGAYIVSTNGVSMDKVDFVLNLVEDVRCNVTSRSDSLANAAQDILRIKGMGTFLTGQVIADLKYTTLLLGAPDWFTWCASGPGSRRGLNRLLDRALNDPWKEADFQVQINLLQSVLANQGIDIHAQDTQNMLCEWDKYRRVETGTGVPKQRYIAATGT